MPKANETCGDGVDDDCNGVADDLCGKQKHFVGGRLVGASLHGNAGKLSVRGVLGGSPAAQRSKGTKITFDSGLYSWLQGLK